MLYQTKQIVDLLKAGHSPQDVATMLHEDIDNILIISNALKLNEAQKVISLPIITNRDGVESIDTKEYDNAQAIYKANQKQIAKRLVTIATTEVDNIGAATKACIYINEEATGRNDARAKKQNNILLFKVGEALLQLNQAKDRVSEALLNEGKIDNMIAIDV